MADVRGGLFVLDVSGYVFRAYYALPPLTNALGEPTQAVRGFTMMLRKLVAEHHPEGLVAAMDSPGRSFREDMYSEYKANRDAAPEDLSQQMVRCAQVLEAYGVTTLAEPGMEADDLIASVVAQAPKRFAQVTVVSSDKDLLQLVDDRVCMLDTARKRTFFVADVADKFGVRPDQMGDYLALVGDSSDNVPGVPGIGPKTAVKLLGEFGKLEGVLAGAEGLTQKKLKSNLTEFADQARLSRRLVTLKDDLDTGVDFDALAWTGGDAEKLGTLFQELGFMRLAEQAQEAVDTPAVQAEIATGGGTIDLWEVNADELPALETRLQNASEVAVCLVDSKVDDKRGDGVDFAVLCWEEGDALRVARVGMDVGFFTRCVFEHRWEWWTTDVKRDLWWLYRRGIHVNDGAFAQRPWWSVDLMSYVSDGARPTHDLAVFAERLGVVAPPGTTPPVADACMTFRSIQRWRAQAPRESTENPPPDPAPLTSSAHLVEQLETPLAHVLFEMERDGVHVDGNILKRMSTEVGTIADRLVETCHELAGHPFLVSSPRQLETVLFDELQLPVVKKTKTARSTDHSVLEELSALHPLPKAIVEYRMLTKLKNTYLDPLPEQIDATTGRIHGTFQQTVAATGRLSSIRPNLQNIPIRTPLGRQVRTAFCAEPGHVLLRADYSQIELRILAHLSGDEALVNAFSHGDDVHAQTASALFDITVEEVTDEQRSRAKTVNFAVIYGQTQFALSKGLGISRAEAQRYIDAFFERYAGVQRYFDGLLETARKSGVVETMMGRKRQVPELNSRNHNTRMGAERIAKNTPIQGSAADVMKQAMVHVRRGLVQGEFATRIVLSVHDELVLEVPEQEREPVESLVLKAMEQVVKLQVPLTVDHGWGANWDQAH